MSAVSAAAFLLLAVALGAGYRVVDQDAPASPLRCRKPSRERRACSRPACPDPDARARLRSTRDESDRRTPPARNRRVAAPAAPFAGMAAKRHAPSQPRAPAFFPRSQARVMEVVAAATGTRTATVWTIPDFASRGAAPERRRQGESSHRALARADARRPGSSVLAVSRSVSPSNPDELAFA